MDEIHPDHQNDPYLSDPDVVLMLEFQNGSAKSFEALLIKYYPRVLNFIARFGIDPHAAEDLTQEVFLKVYNYAPQYRPRAKFQTWLLTMVRNAALNAVRDQRKNAFSLNDDTNDYHESSVHQTVHPDQNNPREEMIDRERAKQVQEAINALPENQRWAVLLKRYEHMSYEEIAQTMNCSQKAVKSLLNRAKESLAVSLAKLEKRF